MNDIDDVQILAEAALRTAKVKTNMRHTMEPIDWAHLYCASAARIEHPDGTAHFRVVIEQAAPEKCPRLCKFIKESIELHGYTPIEVLTNW